MSNIHIESISEPFDTPSVAIPAMQLISRAEGMGLLEGIGEIQRLDENSFAKIMKKITKAGIATKTIAGKLRVESEQLEEELQNLLKMLDDSPIPKIEWKAVSSMLGEEMLQQVLHVSRSSIRRYTAENRETPQHVADQLHFLALLIGDLKSGYNEYGIRRWFQRPRSFLNGKSVTQVLKRGWSPDDEVARAIRNDAAWVSSGAA